MADNTNDEVDLYETEEVDDTQQTKYIMWSEEEENNNQRPILQPVSGNGGKKLKDRVENASRREKKVRQPDSTQVICTTREGKIPVRRVESGSFV